MPNATPADQRVVLGDLDHARVLAALYNAAAIVPFALGCVPTSAMSNNEARKLLAETYGRFDYLDGRRLFLFFRGPTLSTRGYNQANGAGLAEQVIDQLRRSSGNEPEPSRYLEVTLRDWQLNQLPNGVVMTCSARSDSQTFSNIGVGFTAGSDRRADSGITPQFWFTLKQAVPAHQTSEELAQAIGRALSLKANRQALASFAGGGNAPEAISGRFALPPASRTGQTRNDRLRQVGAWTPVNAADRVLELASPNDLEPNRFIDDYFVLVYWVRNVMTLDEQAAWADENNAKTDWGASGKEVEKTATTELLTRLVPRILDYRPN